MNISKNCYLIERKKAPKNKIKFFFILGLLFFIACLFLFQNTGKVFASGNLLGTIKEGGLEEIGSAVWGGEPTDVRLVVTRVIRIVLGFVGIIFFILTILAGFNWMTSAGNEEKITKAKKQLSSAIIGLIIIVAAYSITYFVIEKVIEATTGTAGTG